jgi:hypothetical protein
VKSTVDVALADGAVEKIADPDSSLVVGRRVYYPSRGYGVVDKVDSGAAKPFRVVFEDGGESRQARPPTPATNGWARLGDWCVRAVQFSREKARAEADGTKHFEFDYVFEPTTTQDEVFNTMGKPVLKVYASALRHSSGRTREIAAHHSCRRYYEDTMGRFSHTVKRARARRTHCSTSPRVHQRLDWYVRTPLFLASAARQSQFAAAHPPLGRLSRQVPRLATALFHHVLQDVWHVYTVEMSFLQA